MAEPCLVDLAESDLFVKKPLESWPLLTENKGQQ